MENCYDYVIKDGQLIGEFEKIYQEFDNPWGQASDEYVINSPARMATVIYIRKYKIKSIVEIGCGLGHYTNFIHRSTGIKIKGVDVSGTAIKKAKKNFPHLDFEVGGAEQIAEYTTYDAILFAGMMWYILADLNQIFQSMLHHLPSKYFLNNLVFHNQKQSYGREFFTNIDELVEYMPFPLLASSENFITDKNVTETSSIFRIQAKNLKEKL